MDVADCGGWAITVTDPGRFGIAVIGFALSVVTGLMMSATESAGATIATVRGDTPLYVQMSTKSQVVGRLRAGARVSLELAVAGSDGEWCQVTDTEPGGPAGFVPCDALERSTTGDERRAAPQAGEEPSKSAAPKDTWREVSPAPETAFQARNNPAYWASRLGFTTQQYAAMSELEARTGVAQCRDREAGIMRKYGIGTARDDAGKFEAAVREWGRYAAECYLNLGRFWQAFPTLMTPKQRAQYCREWETLDRAGSRVMCGSSLR